MRYQVGQKYIFLNVDYTANGLAFMYRPWKDKLNKIEVVVLMCTAHHRVPVAYSNDKADGFVFTDADGNVWHNQYPTAHYGQMDDSGDGKVNRGIVDGVNPDDFTKAELWGYTDAGRMIDDIIRAVNPKSSLFYMGDEYQEEIAALKEFQSELIAAVADAGFDVEIGPLQVTRTDGTVEFVEDIPKAYITERVAEAA